MLQYLKKKNNFCPQKVEEQKNSCSKIWLIVQLYTKLGPKGRQSFKRACPQTTNVHMQTDTLLKSVQHLTFRLCIASKLENDKIQHELEI